jgi:hypothetical protein
MNIYFKRGQKTILKKYIIYMKKKNEITYTEKQAHVQRDIVNYTSIVLIIIRKCGEKNEQMCGKKTKIYIYIYI